MWSQTNRSQINRSQMNVVSNVVVSNERGPKQRRSQGGAEGAQAPPPLAIRILMFIFLVFHQHCKSRSGAVQNILWQYHKA